MKDRVATVRQAWRFLLILAAVLVTLTAGSLYFDVRNLDGEYRRLAMEMGRSFFQAIDAMRDWNLRHGGIYVKEDSGIEPSPYLPTQAKNATTTDGEKLTLISHAHMTRLLSELLTDQRGIHIHITSLTPIRPGNAPDDWERYALSRFQQGSREEYDVLGRGQSSMFRFMAPLPAKAECNSCHSQHDGTSESVRGGISISFSYRPFLDLMSSQRKKVIILHAAFLGLGLGVVLLTGRRLLTSIGALQESLLQIKRLEGLVPICAHCKKIRLSGADPKNPDSWVEIERYIMDRTDAFFSHGMCPRCYQEFYPEYYNKVHKS